MANVITPTILVDSERKLVVNYHLNLDTAETFLLVDVSTFNGHNTIASGRYWDTVKVDRIAGTVGGITDGTLAWDAGTDVPFWRIQGDEPFDYDFRSAGGLINTKAATYTGDINMTVANAAGGDDGQLLIYMTKRKS